MKFKEKLEELVAKHPVVSGFVAGGTALGVTTADFINKSAHYPGYNDDPSAIILGVSIPLAIGAGTAFIGNLIGKYKENQQKLKELAQKDELTGLYNRRGYLNKLPEVIEHSHRTDQKILVMYADIDKLKEINDRYKEHEGGDKAIKYVAAAMKRALPRITDLVARVGGDEYIGVGITGDEPVKTMLKRFNESLSESQKEVPFPLSVSMGIKYIDPKEHEKSLKGMQAMVSEALTKAEIAMYEVKEQKKNGTYQNP